MQTFDLFLRVCVQTYGIKSIPIYEIVLKLRKNVYLNNWFGAEFSINARSAFE